MHSNGCKVSKVQKHNIHHSKHNYLHSAKTKTRKVGKKITLHKRSNLLILPNVCGFDPSSEV